MDGPPAQSLGVEPVHGAIVKRAPRKATDPVISMRLMLRVLSSGALIVVGTLWVFSLGMTQVWERKRVHVSATVVCRSWVERVLEKPLSGFRARSLWPCSHHR